MQYKVVAVYVCVAPDRSPMDVGSFSNINAAYSYKEECEKDCPKCKYEVQTVDTK